MIASKKCRAIPVLVMLVFAVSILFSAQNSAGDTISVKPSIRVISPNGGEFWREGETHQIRWKAVGVKRVCISVGIGGKDKGLIVDDECRIDAKLGSVSWKIPKGFVTGFGISSADNARVLIFDPENPDVSDFSDGYFTIASAKKGGHGQGEPRKPCPMDDFANCIRSYFDNIAKRNYKDAYNLLSPCKAILYNADGSAIAFQPRGNFEPWKKTQEKSRSATLEKIEHLDTPGTPSGGSAVAVFGIRLYAVTLRITEPSRPSSPRTETRFVYTVRGIDNRVRILSIGTGP